MLGMMMHHVYRWFVICAVLILLLLPQGLAAQEQSKLEQSKPAQPKPEQPKQDSPASSQAADVKSADSLTILDQLVLLKAEIKAGIHRRSQDEVFDRYLSWTANRIDASAGVKSWSDKTGNARLSWVEKMLREPFWAVDESERLSRGVFTMAGNETAGLIEMMAIGRERLDLPARKTPLALLKPANAQDAIKAIASAMEAADKSMTQSLEPLTLQQRRDLRKLLYPVTTGDLKYAYSFSNQKLGRQLCDLIEKLDRDALYSAGEAVVPLTSADVLKALASYEIDKDAPAAVVPGVSGLVHQRIKTEAGDIIIGSVQDNIYDLDHMPNVAAVIDLGGNDTYLDGQLSLKRQVLIVIDLAGDDIYRGEKPGIQGGAILGVSLLVDAAGKNTYQGKDIAQGASLVGTGILIDKGSDTTYKAIRRSQGSAIAGVGLLLDEQGDDEYRAALLSQGVGGPWGLGVAVDLKGEDLFFAGGVFASSYNDSPGFEAWSQGVGVGPRGVANGGIGLLLSGPGDDVYECDYFSHGGGYWFAVGIARDFAGNDQRVGSTRTAYDGGERTAKRFLRWGIGFQAHYGVGFVIDDQGNDHYEGNTASIGFSWDIGLAAVLDFQGDDVYVNPRAQGSEAAMGILFDANGNDTYRGGTQGHAREEVSYHKMPDAGGNFSFLIDYGGKNTFAKDIVDHSYNQRGAPGGFLISRPATPTLEQIPLDFTAAQ